MTFKRSNSSTHKTLYRRLTTGADTIMLNLAPWLSVATDSCLSRSWDGPTMSNAHTFMPASSPGRYRSHELAQQHQTQIPIAP